RRALGGDGRRVDLRPRPGRAESDAVGAALVPARGAAPMSRTIEPVPESLVEPQAGTVEFELDGRSVLARDGETIYEVARRHGTTIPTLCRQEGYRPDGNCRACVVEIDGERVLAPSCCRTPAAGMKVRSASARARAAQRMVVELLLADAPATPHREDSELAHWA